MIKNSICSVYLPFSTITVISHTKPWDGYKRPEVIIFYSLWWDDFLSASFNQSQTWSSTWPQYYWQSNKKENTWDYAAQNFLMTCTQQVWYSLYGWITSFAEA